MSRPTHRLPETRPSPCRSFRRPPSSHPADERAIRGRASGRASESISGDAAEVPAAQARLLFVPPDRHRVRRLFPAAPAGQQHRARRAVRRAATTSRSSSYYPASAFGQDAFGEPDYRALRSRQFAAGGAGQLGADAALSVRTERVAARPAGLSAASTVRASIRSGPTTAGAMCSCVSRTASTSR